GGALPGGGGAHGSHRAHHHWVWADLIHRGTEGMMIRTQLKKGICATAAMVCSLRRYSVISTRAVSSARLPMTLRVSGQTVQTINLGGPSMTDNRTALGNQAIVAPMKRTVMTVFLLGSLVAVAVPGANGTVVCAKDGRKFNSDNPLLGLPSWQICAFN